MRSTSRLSITGKRLLLANKESVVVAGALLMREVADNGAEILPSTANTTPSSNACRRHRRSRMRIPASSALC